MRLEAGHASHADPRLREADERNVFGRNVARLGGVKPGKGME